MERSLASRVGGKGAVLRRTGSGRKLARRYPRALGKARVCVTAILQKVPLFGQLSPAELDRVAEITRERSYPRNSVILFEDDPGDALYVVAKGQVKVVLIGEDGREVILSVLGEGDFFGEMSLIDEEPRSAP